MRVPAARLAAVQRILRTQPFGTRGQQHFTLLALVTAGRDRGGHEFEHAALLEQLAAAVGAVRAVTDEPIELRLTPLTAAGAALADAARSAGLDVTARNDPERVSGRGYYGTLCWKLILGRTGDAIEIGGGGFTDWTQRLLGNRKERLLVGGLGLDRLARRVSG